jgi:hypothetical protein
MRGYHTGQDEAFHTLGLTDLRFGRRAVGHCGPENDDWEEYAEVPISDLLRIATELKTLRNASVSEGVPMIDGEPI